MTRYASTNSIKLVRLGILAIPLAMVAIPGTAMVRPSATAGVTFGTVAGGGCGAKGSFTVATASGTVVVDDSKRTRCVPNSPAAVIAGFQKGDAVLAHIPPGRVPEARVVLYDKSPFAVPGTDRLLHGTYAQSSNGQISITQSNGSEVTVAVGPSTRYVENGSSVSTPNYASGDKVDIHACEYTDSHEWAMTVTIKGKKRR